MRLRVHRAGSPGVTDLFVRRPDHGSEMWPVGALFSSLFEFCVR
jgi:hypothetical protein